MIEIAPTLDPAQQATLSEALQNCLTHREVWRGAIASHCTPFGSDDDGSYWDHELRVFDRTFAALTASLPWAEGKKP